MAAPRDVVDRASQLARSIGSLVGTDPIAPTLSINAPIGRGRRIETVRVAARAGARTVRKAFGCTVNDVVLAGVGGALARLLDARGELHPDLSVKVFCPVSVRDDERAHAARQPHLGDVRAARGRRARRRGCGSTRCAPTTADLKEREQARRRGRALGLSEYAAPTLLGLAARAAHGQRFANLIVTNIPGPQVPALLPRRARCSRCTRSSPLSRNLTINVAVMSYCGQLHFGLVGDGAAAPDLETARRRHRGRLRRALRPRRR